MKRRGEILPIPSSSRPGGGRHPEPKWTQAFAGVTRRWRHSIRLTVYAVLLCGFGLPFPTLADEEPKRGGSLNYTIPADAPPSFDDHRETTYATIHTAAPFYSVLIRVNPDNLSSTTDFVCDLCTAMPQPTDGGKI